MKRWALFSTVAVLSTAFFVLAGCGGDVFHSADSLNSSPPGGVGATPGGVQDMGLARELIANGVVPPADALIVEGMFSEHDLPLQGEECRSLFCLRGALGWQDDHGWIQIGLSSNVDPDMFERPRSGFVLLVDVSSSMGWGYDEYGPPAQITHDLMRSMVEQFGSEDAIGIASFAGGARLVLDFVPGDQHDRLIGEIESLIAGGSTNMEAGLQLVQIMFARADLEVEQKRVVLLTDAQPNVGASDPDSFLELAEELQKDGIELTVVGCGIGLNPDVMQAMINLRGGNGFSISTAGMVEGFMDDNWPWMICPIAYDLSVEVVPGGSFRVTNGYGFPGGSPELQVATVFLSKRRGALLLRLEGGSFTELGAELQVTYASPGGELFGESFSLAVSPEAELDEEGRYFDQYSTQKTTALARLVAGMHDAADLYMSNRDESVAWIKTTAERFDSDSAALIAQGQGDQIELERELALVREMEQLVIDGAPQGTMYGP